MSGKHTGNTGFHSKSNGAGTSRWRLDPAPHLPRAYVVQVSKPNLPFKFYAMGLLKDAQGYRINVAGYSNDEHASIEEAHVTGALNANPDISSAGNTTDEAVMLERFERTVANVMHGDLDPVPACRGFFERLATEDGTKIFRPL